MFVKWSCSCIGILLPTEQAPTRFRKLENV